MVSITGKHIERLHVPLAVLWLALALTGLVGTWAFNIAFVADPGGLGYVEAWFVNPATTSAAVDLIVVAVAACMLFLVEGARLGWARWAWVFIPLTFLVALAFSLPLFLALRELALRRSARDGSEKPLFRESGQSAGSARR